MMGLLSIFVTDEKWRSNHVQVQTCLTLISLATAMASNTSQCSGASTSIHNEKFFLKLVHFTHLTFELLRDLANSFQKEFNENDSVQNYLDGV